MLAESFRLRIVGLRNAAGRFTRMSDGGLRQVQLERAEVLAAKVQEEARRLAPVGKSELTGERKRFYESLEAQTEATETGFRIVLKTDQGQLRQWLREGTAAHEIEAVNASALRFETAEGAVYARRVQHPGTKPNDWEDRLRMLVESEARDEAGRIGARLAKELTNRP